MPGRDLRIGSTSTSREADGSASRSEIKTTRNGVRGPRRSVGGGEALARLHAASHPRHSDNAALSTASASAAAAAWSLVTLSTKNARASKRAHGHVEDLSVVTGGVPRAASHSSRGHSLQRAPSSMQRKAFNGRMGCSGVRRMAKS